MPMWRSYDRTVDGNTTRGLAVVTGASSGIGTAFVRALADRGWSVALVGRDADRLDTVAKDVSATTWAIAADLTEPDGLGDVEAFIRNPPCPIDMLINNAGAAWWGPFASHDEHSINCTIDLNVTALVRLTRAVIPPMVARGSGGIINISSLASGFPQRNMAVYAASKAFVDSFSRSLRDELRGTGVRVTCVRPSWVRSDFHNRSGQSTDDVTEWLEPEDVADRALMALTRNREMVALPREPSPMLKARWRARRSLSDHVPDWVRTVRHARSRG